MLSRAGTEFEAGRSALVDLVANDRKSALAKAIDAARSGQVDIEPVEFVLGDQGERSGRLYFSLAPADDGEAATVLVHAIDTTDQRALEVQFAQGQKCRPLVSWQVELHMISITC